MQRNASANPFKPTAGAEPPVLAGRKKVIDDFTDGLTEGPGAPGRLMRISGPRGSGKTVLLTELGDIAKDKGWVVVDETAGKGLVDRITERLARQLPEANASMDIDLGFVKAHAGVSSGTGGADIRTVLDEAAGRIGKKGVLVTVDEVQDADKGEMAAISQAVQHLIREKKDVAFVFAGLTMGVADFINGEAMTFLRRAKAEQLKSIPDDDVAAAFEKTFGDSGMPIAGNALSAAVAATGGYAYMVQLVGYNVWKVARRHFGESPAVAMEDVREGAEMAMGDYVEAVIEPALSRLSKRAMSYLVEMSRSDGPSSTGCVAKSLGVPAQSLSSVRASLIAKQVIEPTEARGYVDFAIPWMREYVGDHAIELMDRFPD